MPGQLTKAATTTATNYTRTSLTANTTYYFEIVAVDTCFNDSAPSKQIAVTTLPLPAAPVKVDPDSKLGDDDERNLDGKHPAEWPADQVLLRLPGHIAHYLTNVATRATAEYVDTTALSNTTYYYAVEAVDQGMNVSPMSVSGAGHDFRAARRAVNVDCDG